MSEAKKGTHLSEETRQKIAESLRFRAKWLKEAGKGFHHTEATKERLRKIGKKRGTPWKAINARSALAKLNRDMIEGEKIFDPQAAHARKVKKLWQDREKREKRKKEKELEAQK